MTFVGSIASLDLVWNLADLFMAFLVLTNISSIVRMGRTAGLALDDYIKQRKAGIETPVFNRSVLNHTYGIVWWGDGQNYRLFCTSYSSGKYNGKIKYILFRDR